MYGFPEFANASSTASYGHASYSYAEAIQRPIYTAMNNRKVDVGNPMFGPVSGERTAACRRSFSLGWAASLRARPLADDLSRWAASSHTRRWVAGISQEKMQEHLDAAKAARVEQQVGVGTGINVTEDGKGCSCVLLLTTG